MENTEASRNGKRVVVIGGGIAGSLIARSLQFHAHVTLVDSKEYFEMPYASLRAMVEPSLAERSIINHRDYLQNGFVITSAAIDITETAVLTAEGRQVPYDYLVIATGHEYPVPKTKAERLGQFQAENQKITSADSILIIGGDRVGVELAGEIVGAFPKKKVTLVHSGSRLLEFIGPKAAEKALKWLTSKKVEVKLEQAVNLDIISDGNNIYQTSAGETIKADCHYLCIEKSVGSAWLKETILKNDLDKDGRIKVDAHLRVKGRNNIFAIGDINDVQEIKLGYLALQQAQVASKNLKILIAEGKESKMASYEPKSPMVFVSLGKKEAVAQFPFATIIGRIAGMFKSRDLFVGWTRKQLGLQSY